jgi:hypothetical protein
MAVEKILDDQLIKETLDKKSENADSRIRLSIHATIPPP